MGEKHLLIDTTLRNFLDPSTLCSYVVSNMFFLGGGIFIKPDPSHVTGLPEYQTFETMDPKNIRIFSGICDGRKEHQPEKALSP